CNPTQGLTSCGQNPCGNCGCNSCGASGTAYGSMPVTNGGMPMPVTSMPVGPTPTGANYEELPDTKGSDTTTVTDQKTTAPIPLPAPPDITLPPGATEEKPAKSTEAP